MNLYKKFEEKKKPSSINLDKGCDTTGEIPYTKIKYGPDSQEVVLKNNRFEEKEIIRLVNRYKQLVDEAEDNTDWKNLKEILKVYPMGVIGEDRSSTRLIYLRLKPDGIIQTRNMNKTNPVSNDKLTEMFDKLSRRSIVRSNAIHIIKVALFANAYKQVKDRTTPGLCIVNLYGIDVLMESKLNYHSSSLYISWKPYAIAYGEYFKVSKKIVRKKQTKPKMW